MAQQGNQQQNKKGGQNSPQLRIGYHDVALKAVATKVEGVFEVPVAVEILRGGKPAQDALCQFYWGNTVATGSELPVLPNGRVEARVSLELKPQDKESQLWVRVRSMSGDQQSKSFFLGDVKVTKPKQKIQVMQVFKGGGLPKDEIQIFIRHLGFTGQPENSTIGFWDFEEKKGGGLGYKFFESSFVASKKVLIITRPFLGKPRTVEFFSIDDPGAEKAYVEIPALEVEITEASKEPYSPLEEIKRGLKSGWKRYFEEKAEREAKNKGGDSDA